MKVKYCKKCKPHFERRKWSTTFKPAGYHEIGVSHVYAFCKKYDCKCLEVKGCKIHKEIMEKERI